MLQQVFHNVKNKLNLFFEKKEMLQQIKSDIFSKYGFNIVKFKPLANGFVHLSYKCNTSDNKTFVLRVMRDADPAAIRLEGNLLDQLSKDPDINNRIVTMISDRYGQKMGQIDGHLYCLFNYIDHEQIFSMSDNHIQSIVFLIRKIHDIGVNFYQHYEERDLIDAHQISNNLFNFYSKNIITQDEFNNMNDIVTEFNAAIAKYHTKTILHCDIHRGNLLFNKDNKQVFLLDFDDFCVGPAIFDLAIMMQMFCLEKNIFDIEMAKKIIKAYHEASMHQVDYDVHDLINFMLFNMVYACEYYLQVSDEPYKSVEYKIVYHRIEHVQSCSENIMKKLKF